MTCAACKLPGLQVTYLFGTGYYHKSKMPVPTKRTSSSSSALAKRTKTTTKKTKKAYVPTKVFIGKQPLPLQLFNTMKYAQQVVITTSAAGFKVYQFSCNALYDPDVTGAGHQPSYFDQIMAIYDHYTVLKARFKITPCVNTDQTAPFFACVYVDDDTSAVTSYEQALEQRNSTRGYHWLPPSGPPPTISYWWDAAKTFGPNPQAQDSLQGTATSNPTEQSYFTFVVQNASSVSVSFTAVVEIEYDTVFDELKTIAQS